MKVPVCSSFTKQDGAKYLGYVEICGIHFDYSVLKPNTPAHNIAEAREKLQLVITRDSGASIELNNEMYEFFVCVIQFSWTDGITSAVPPTKALIDFMRNFGVEIPE